MMFSLLVSLFGFVPLQRVKHSVLAGSVEKALRENKQLLNGLDSADVSPSGSLQYRLVILCRCLAALVAY